jgi:hypothetical protein
MEHMPGRGGVHRPFVGGAASLDATGTDPWRGTVSLPWVLMHMVEEYAQHNGHANLLRETIDGKIGRYLPITRQLLLVEKIPPAARRKYHFFCDADLSLIVIKPLHRPTAFAVCRS